MRPIFCADWRVLMLAIASLAIVPAASLQAQQDQPKSGTEATPAVGSQVAPMKPGCPPATEAGDKQKQHPPTEAMNKAVPPMKAGDCPADDAMTGTKQPPK